MAEGNEVAKAFVTIAGDKTQLDKDLNDAKGGLTTWLTGLGTAMGAIALFPPALIAVLGGAVITAGAAALVGWTSRAIDLETQAARMAATLATVGKNSGQSVESINELAKALESVGTANREELRAAATEMLRFNEIKGDNFTVAMKAASDYATVLGTDLTSAAKAVGMALQNPMTAIRSLRQVGLTADQGKEISSLMREGRVNAARNLVLGFFAELSGAAELMSDITEESIEGLWEGIARLGDGIGTALLPIVKQVFGQMLDLVKSLEPVFEKVTDLLKESTPAIQEFIGLIGDGLTTAIQYVVTAIVNWRDTWALVSAAAALAFNKVRQGMAGLEMMIGVQAGTLDSIFVALGVTVAGIFHEIKESILADFRGVVAEIVGMARMVASLSPTMKVAIAGADLAGIGPDFAKQEGKAFDRAAAKKRFEKVREEMPKGDKHVEKLAKEEEDLKNEIARLADKIGDARAGLFKADWRDAAVDQAKKLLDKKGGFDESKDSPKTKAKFQTVGLADAWKKMQESISGGTMIDLTRAGLAQGKEQLDELKAINKKIADDENDDEDDGIIDEG